LRGFMKMKTAKKKADSKRLSDVRSFGERYADVLAPNSIAYRMKLLSQLLERRFQQMLEPFHLTPLHWAALCCLWQSDGMPTTELGKRLGQLRGTVVVVLEIMEKAGYITRRPDKRDQRVSRIWLTDRGEALKSSLPRMAQELQNDALQVLSVREVKVLSGQLDRLLERNIKAGLGSSTSR